MKRDRHAATVRMDVVAMTAGLTVEREAVADEGSDQVARGEVSKLRVINCHASDGDGDARV